MDLKIPITNRGYIAALEQIGTILKKVMANKEVEQIFNHYTDLTHNDEAAAILTLAEVIKGSDCEAEAKPKIEPGARQQAET